MLLLTVKALHIIAIIAWMAGLLYLPRLMVYHVRNVNNTHMSQTFKTMETRLIKIIMNPSMALSWVLGLWLAFSYDYWSDIWFYIKLLFVLMLTSCHIYLSLCARRFSQDKNTHTERFFRIINEIPAVLMILIVLLVVVKPF